MRSFAFALALLAAACGPPPGAEGAPCEEAPCEPGLVCVEPPDCGLEPPGVPCDDTPRCGPCADTGACAAE